MNNIIRATEKKYCSTALMLSGCVGAILIFSGLAPLGKGLILGTLFSIVNFVLIGETLPDILNKSRAKTFALSMGSIFCRYLLLSVPVFIAIRFEHINLFTTIGGLFAVQVIIIMEQVWTLIHLKTVSNLEKK